MRRAKARFWSESSQRRPRILDAALEAIVTALCSSAVRERMRGSFEYEAGETLEVCQAKFA
jgi:hypothetical protein